MADKNFPLLTIGTIVSYKDTEGRVKPAMVIGTPNTVTPGTQIPVPQDGFFHIKVIGYGAHEITRLDVPFETVAAEIPDYTIGGELRGVVLAETPAY